jgi:hypothetical protein
MSRNHNGRGRSNGRGVIVATAIIAILVVAFAVVTAADSAVDVLVGSAAAFAVQSAVVADVMAEKARVG